MPGTEPRLLRRPQYAGISKSSKNKTQHGTLNRPHINITAIIKSPQIRAQTINDARAISRICNSTPPRQPVVAPPAQTTVPPPQVVLFFDHIHGNSPAQRSHEEAAQYCRSLRDDMSIARNKLQALLPAKEDVVKASEHASSWMSLYHGLYSLTYTFRTGYQLVMIHDKMRDPEVHPVLLSMWLLCVAISLQQVPSGTVIGKLSRSDFVLQVCDIVEEVIVRKNILAGSVEGLETCMLLLMLASGRNDLTTIVVTLKRLLALAELMGLPRAGYEYATQAQPTKLDAHLQAKLRIWEAICATDRNFGMMLKLPASTTGSIFPLHKIIWRSGVDCSSSFNYYLARVCGMVIAIDKAYSNEEPEKVAYVNVEQAEHALQALASAVPDSWLNSTTGKPAELVAKFWHPYIRVRSHLRPAMVLSDQYNKDREIVRTSCAEALRMFCNYRIGLPRGFFYCRVLDIQAFTTAVLLLLFGQEGAIQGDELVDLVIRCYDTVAKDTASSFARKAVTSLSSLQKFIRGHGPTTTTVHISLLGNVRVIRRDDSDVMSSAQDCMDVDSHIDRHGQSPDTPGRGISFSIDFENDSPWTPPASRAGGYGRD